MTYNPYQAPDPAFGALDSARDVALAAVRGPGTWLIVVSSIGLAILVLAAIVDGFLLLTSFPEMIQQPGEDSERTTIVIRLAFSVVLGGVQVLILFGAVNMRRLRRFRLVQTAAVLSVVPCCSSCYLLGIPFGAWALVVLARPDVQAAFE